MPCAKSLEIPFDVVELIIDNVAGWGDDSYSGSNHDNEMALKCCALVCRSFLPLIRKHLFRFIYLNSVRRLRNMENFAALLRASPEIANYVFGLTLHIHDVRSIPSMDFTMFSRLKHLRLLYGYVDTWHLLDFDEIDSPQLKNILLYPIPTLESLELSSLSNYPFYNLLLLYPNLRSLNVSQTTADEIHTSMGMLPLQPIKLDTFISGKGTIQMIQKLLQMRQSNGQPVIDISGLKHLDIWYDAHSIWSMVRRLLRGIDRLREFSITPVHGRNLNGLAGLLLPFMKSLEEIHVFTDDMYDDSDPFLGLCEELEILGDRPNVLTQLSYRTAVSTDCALGDEWGKLDEVIDRYTWPMLKRITLNIDIMEDAAKDTVLRSKLDDLPQRYLPKLDARSRKDLDFQYLVGYD